MDGDWEKALAVFASSTQTSITNRHEFGDDGKASWFSNWKAQQSNSFTESVPFDVWWSYNYVHSNGRPYSYVLGVNLDWGLMAGADTLLGKLVREPRAIMEPLVWAPNQNDRVSVWSFDAAATMLHGVGNFLQAWLPMVREWAGSIDAPGSDWQGSAASGFKAVLNAFASELENVNFQLNDHKYAHAIEDSRSALSGAAIKMINGYGAWMGDRLVWPVNAVHDAFMEAMKSCTVTVQETITGDTVVTTEPVLTISSPVWGSPTTQEFWDKIQSDAKKRWRQHVSDTLDTYAAQALADMDVSYQQSITTLGSGIIAQTLQLPPAKQDTSTSTNPLDQLDKNLADMNKNMNDSMTSIGTGMGDAFKQMSTGMGEGFKNMGTGLTGMSTGMGDAFKQMSTGMGTGFTGMSTGMGDAFKQMSTGMGTGFESLGLGAGTGTGNGVVDKNGNPVFGSDGKQVVVPAGGYIGDGGQIYDSTGKPVTDKNGNPVKAPAGSTVSGSTSSPLGGNAKVPVGSKVNSDGTVVDQNGKTVTDANGNKVVLGKGYTVAADGTVLDSQGRPVSQQTQLINDEFAPTNRSSSSSSDPLMTPSFKYATGTGTGSGDSDPYVIGSSTAGTGLGGGLGLGANQFSARTGMSSKAVANGGDPLTANAAAAEQEAARKAMAAQEAKVAEQAQVMGRTQATSSGMPMVPPMGGGGGAGGPGEKDRQRTTWLAEDEEVWGTESSAVSGVIGR
ncbi:hypothetical protein KNE206_57000 [Kitasatospora sp. NE20-6]|uniref:hypothetical protein n=1 Tax=Kitasatospora sp. NE20-6 TaxID=2859066 RepID=UPI0034DC2D29